MAIVTTSQARTPYARIPAKDATADRELQKIERAMSGLWVPKVVTANYTITGTEWMLCVDTTAGAITITFPSAALVNGLHVMIVKANASANAVTLSGTFSGVSNPTLVRQFQSTTIEAGNGVYYFPGTAAGVFSAYNTVNVANGATVRGATNYVGNALDTTASASIANNGTLNIGDINSMGGVYIVAADGTGAVVDQALVALLNGIGGTVIVNAIRGTWGNTTGSGAAYDVVWNAGAAKYRIENKSGGARFFYVSRLGSFPSQ